MVVTSGVVAAKTKGSAVQKNRPGTFCRYIAIVTYNGRRYIENLLYMNDNVLRRRGFKMGPILKPRRCKVQNVLDTQQTFCNWGFQHVLT